MFLLKAPPPTTKPPAPLLPEAPQNLAADPLMTSATISWNAPPDNGAEIMGYRLTYGTLDNPKTNTLTFKRSKTETIVDGLESNTDYLVSLVAFNDDGESPVTEVALLTEEGMSKTCTFKDLFYLCNLY